VDVLKKIEHPEDYSPEAIQKKMKQKGQAAIDHMNRKYGVTFTPLSYNVADYLSTTDSVDCYTEGMDPEKEHVTVRILQEENEADYHFIDNYYYFRLRDSLEAFAADVVKKEFPDALVTLTGCSAAPTDDMGPDTTIDDLFRRFPNARFSYKILVGSPELSQEEFDQKAEAVSRGFADTGRVVTVFIEGMDNNASLNKYNATIRNGEIRVNK
jgi:hypothetical protein